MKTIHRIKNMGQGYTLRLVVTDNGKGKTITIKLKRRDRI